MRHVSSAVFLLPLLASACATPGPRIGEIAFVQGCWVQRASPGEERDSTLNVELNEEEAAYYGHLDRPQSADGARTLSFSSDGASALIAAVFLLEEGGTVYGTHSFTRDDTTDPNDREGFNRAVFNSNEDTGGMLIVEASKDRLKISSTIEPDQRTMFDGQRADCD
jgi:hypothetical protein